ncbi:general transcription and DNA repair factor IIH helicase subunit XPD [Cyclospora cayetanensis]|uniref:DNA 5'-3' helicase n=1 Tax=Cyclospora cayetanensis TaxID=88456 RepID=A0A6P6RWM9_9EIME|nr:general transcription and DNA repair factor IIH helicase subunit XPD [Cyclospora cayetanensis]
MVVFSLEGVRVFFPYDSIYPEQFAYIRAVKRAVEMHGHAVLEMPTGTGKTASLMSILTSMQFADPSMGRIIYCTRTVAEMEKALLELKLVIDYRIKEIEKEKLQQSLVHAQQQQPLGQPGQPQPATEVPLLGKKMRESGYLLGVGLSARRSLCANGAVMASAEREKIDEGCRKRTAPWVREAAADRHQARLAMRRVANAEESSGDAPAAPGEAATDVEDIGNGDTAEGLCAFYENFDEYFTPQHFPAGVYTLEELKAAAVRWRHPVLQRPLPLCPYFLARRLLQVANVVVLNYQYLLDPKVSEQQQQQEDWLGTDTGASVVVFDEAHNIDNVCIEALSVHLNKNTLDQALRNLSELSEEIKKRKAADSEKLRAEYQQLLQGMQQQQQRRQRQQHQSQEEQPQQRQPVTVTSETFQALANPVLPSDIVEEAIPGSIRRAEHFVALMRRVIAFLKIYIKVYDLKSEGPLSFLFGFEKESLVEGSILRHFHSRLKALLLALQVTDLERLLPLTLVADFCTLVGTYWDGFIVIVDPYPEASGLHDPLLQLCCLDASLAMQPVLKRFKSVILTSGTISPLELYPKILSFVPLIAESFPVSMDRACFCPMIVARGADQVPLTSKFEYRHDLSVLRNYANLLLDLCKAVPDGLVCFFPSYAYMETAMSYWYENGFLAQVLEHKLVFLETKDVVSTTLALFNFKKACDCGRGAVFFSVARGKVAEGVDFDRHFGRCVVLFGIPYQYALSRVLKARLDFLRERYQIQENEFLTFDAMRQAAQCVGRVIRSKRDFAIMIFADARFSRSDKRNKLPPWITRYLDQAHLALNTETAVSVCRSFLKSISQPCVSSSALRLGASALVDYQPPAADPAELRDAAAAAPPAATALDIRNAAETKASPNAETVQHASVS